MKVGLIDVDGHNFPNLPLMKISAYHKARGDSVEWYEPLFSGELDRVYMSKVFYIHTGLSILHKCKRDYKRRHRLQLPGRRRTFTGGNRTYISRLWVIWNNKRGIRLFNKRLPA